jgi:hypothetical protein
MADKRKKATGRSQGGGARGGVKRRSRAAPAGRTAVRRDTPVVARVPAVVARAPAMDANSVQIRERIDAAISEAERMRHDIEARIERRFHAEPSDTGTTLFTKVSERFQLGPVQPFFTTPPEDVVAPKRSRKGSR